MFKHEYAHTLEHVTGAIAKIDTQAKLSTPSPKRSTSPDTSKPIAHPITSKFAKKPISGKPRPKIEKSYREIAVQHHDLTVINNHRYGREPVTGTGARNTVTIIKTKQGVMRGTLDVVLVKTQELLWNPVEGAACMRTAVQVTKNLLPLPHNENVVQLFIHTHQRSPTTRVSQFIEMADDRPRGRCHRQAGRLPVAGDLQLE